MSDDEIARLERYFDMRMEKVEARVDELRADVKAIMVIAKIGGGVIIGSAGMGIVLAIQYLATH